MGSDSLSDETPERRFRTLFISDVHLGARGSQADRLLDFLKTHDADTIYLVGDIVDGWALRSNWYWPQSHNDFVQKMLRKARKGAKVIYVPGNHDEFLRNYYGTHFGGIDVVENTIHEGADGKRYLVIHGDIFDLVVQNARWLAHLGDKAYDFAIQMNRLVNFFRRMFGVPYWSLSQWAKLKVKNAVNYIGAFEKTLAGEARHPFLASRRAPHDAYPGRDRCVASPGQRGGADADRDRGSGKGGWRRGELPDAAIVSHLRDAELSRSAAGSAVPGKNRKTDRGGKARQHSYRDRRPDRAIGAALLPQAGPAVHHELSHPLSGICLGALADPGILGVA